MTDCVLMRQVAHRTRFSQPVPRVLALFAALSLLTLSGCPQPPEVSVTVKAAGGAAAEETSEGDTAAEGYGNLVGAITYDGSATELPPLVAVGDSKVKPEDRSVCAATPVPDESLLVNPANKGLANAIIFLDKRPKNIKPELAKPPTDVVVFDQKGCRFLPHVLTVQVGQPLMVVSDDSIPHNTHTFPKRNDSFNKLIGGGDRKGTPCNYNKPESSPVEVKCDYHPWMKAYHFPTDHPYVAVTDKDGNFKIDGLPAGKHSFNVWHERAQGSSQLLERKLEITITPDQDTRKNLSYGAAKFAAISRPASRTIAVDRLSSESDPLVTRTEVKP